MPRWASATLFISLVFIAAQVISISVLYTRARTSARLVEGTIVQRSQASISAALDDVFLPMALVTNSIIALDSTMQKCLPLDSTADLLSAAVTLTSIQDVYGAQRVSVMSDVGIITANRTTAGAIDPSNKISVEVARGYGCPQYMTLYTNSSSRFEGYCSDSGDAIANVTAYAGPDYGLSKLELQILDGLVVDGFEPVSDISGTLAFAYKLGHSCNPLQYGAYAVAFAQRSLADLSDVLVRLQQASFVVEPNSNHIVASYVANQTLPTPSDSLVREAVSRLTAQAGGSLTYITQAVLIDESDMLISAQPYNYAYVSAKVNWLSVVVLKRGDYVSWARHDGAAALAVAIIVSVAALIALVLTMRCYLIPGYAADLAAGGDRQRMTLAASHSTRADPPL
jgi:hypothetical protein